jgi:hypothetical protein
VPCGKRIVVTSSHVNVSDHNPMHLYGTYERIRKKNPFSYTALTLQLVIVEVWLYIVSFSILRAESASFGCKAKLRGARELQLPAEVAIL